MIAVGRYIVLPGSRLAEAAFTVHDTYQGRGIGTFLVNELARIARERGLEGFLAEVHRAGPRMRAVLSRCFRRLEQRDLGGGELLITARFADLSARAAVGKGPAVPCANRRVVLNCGSGVKGNR